MRRFRLFGGISLGLAAVAVLAWSLCRAAADKPDAPDDMGQQQVHLGRPDAPSLLALDDRFGPQVSEFEAALKRVQDSLSARATVAGGSSSGAVFGEWERHRPIARIDDILRMLVFAPHSLSAEEVLYSGTVNPKDRPLPDDSFLVIVGLLRLYHDHMKAASSLRGAIQSEEITQLAAESRLFEAIPAEVAAYEEGALAEKRLLQDYPGLVGAEREQRRQWLLGRIRALGAPAGFVKRASGDRTLYARKSDLIKTRRYDEYIQFRGCEMALAVIDLAGRWGLLTAAEVQERQARVFSFLWV